MCQRDGDADRAVPAHAQVAGVIEEQDARGAVPARRRNQEGSDQCIRSPRFEDDRSADVIMIAGQAFDAFLHAAVAEVRAAVDNDPGWFAFGMRVDITHGNYSQKSRQYSIEFCCRLSI